MVLDQFDRQLDHNGVSTVTQSITPRPTVVRKKFAKPPVKVACLACRSSRTRCDGQDPCANCLSKKRKCSYLPSKRGGPRKKKKHSLPAEDNVRQDEAEHPITTPLSPDFEDSALFGQIDLLSAPAAGLRTLDFSPDVQSLFAGLFVPSDGDHNHAQMEPTPSLSSVSSTSVVRTYGSEHEILNAYYDFIHNYFPILPPRVTPTFIDRPLDGIGSYSESPSEQPILAYQPRSPLSLAMSAVLALVPHPNDPEPSSPSSIIRRRTFAHIFAQLSNASIESDCELHDSPANPFEGLPSSHSLINREPLHPHTPVGLESLLALLVLSVYEYTQRGNLLKMRYRAGQALAIALEMRLHSLGEEHDEYAEARRRAWWMTVMPCLFSSCSASLTQSLCIPLSIDANDSQFVTPYPRFSTDPDGWSILIQSQQILVTATQFVIDLKKCIPTRTNMSYIFESMQRLDTWASTILAQSSLPIPPTDGILPERTTAQSIRVISRIKLSSAQIKIHRFRAFSDIPIFLKRHCDLTKANSDEPMSESPAKISNHPEEISSIGCSCSSLDQFQQSSSSESAPSSTSSTSSEIQSIPQYSFIGEFPFTSQHSARVCLRASLLLSHMFQSLPMPQPLSDHNHSAPVLQLLPQNQYPRTMPSFACCLMQGSYALLMIFYRMSLEKQANQQSVRLTEELRQGLGRIITAATNYTISFEALNGMKDDIQGAYDTAFLQG
ncbi:uncharacterized protein BDV17DRAFT_301764 [Aspergillus undulatus]|uniref:uncharacterized protein n=1 Tax=Aspergillus undulatus TaxID=1810928 RepID=UPI003CCD4BFB